MTDERIDNRPRLRGLVRDRETGEGLGGYVLLAYDRLRRNRSGLLGRATTSLNGVFELRYAASLTAESNLEVVLEVHNRFGRRVATSRPLSGAGRFRARAIDVPVRAGDQRPRLPARPDPFVALADSRAGEIAALRGVGITDLRSLRAADLKAVARDVNVEAPRLESFRLQAEVPVLDGTSATALVTEAGIKSRDQLATRGTGNLVAALNASAQPSRFGEIQVHEWITAAQGHDLTAFADEFDRQQVLHDTGLLADKVLSASPNATIAETSVLLGPASRLAAMEEARALMLEAGVTDLSALGTYSVRTQRVIHAGHYVAHPLTRDLEGIATQTLSDALVAHGQRFKRVEVQPDALYFVHNPVDQAVILGSVVEFVEDGELVIGEDVSSLVIITEEIRYSELRKIRYEGNDRVPEARAARTPARALDGTPDNSPFVYTPGSGDRGANGGNGADGLEGFEGFEGERVGFAPSLSVYVLSTPGGLPEIDLVGLTGGEGGPGQDGGFGGNGARGRPGASALVCTRSVGHGGDGGDGGDGGAGGRGGVGGRGGDLAVYTLADNLARLHDGGAMRIDGGEGGGGGRGGAAGPPGLGGEPGEPKGTCSAKPERAGATGAFGAFGASGAKGLAGPGGMYTSQVITESDWNAAFTMPWIVRLEPWEAQVDEVVTIEAYNLTDDTVVLWDSQTGEFPQALYEEIDVAGGRIRIRIPGGAHGLTRVQLRVTAASGEFVYSQEQYLRILPRLDAVTPTSGVPHSVVTLEGSGFDNDAVVRIGGQIFSTKPGSEIELELVLPDRNNIRLESGTHDIEVVNPDGHVSNALAFEFSSTVRVRVKAWRVVPDVIIMGGGGFGDPSFPSRTEADIRALFRDSPSPGEIWSPHGIELSLDPRIGTVIMPADIALLWPYDASSDVESDGSETRDLLMAEEGGQYRHFDEGAVNIYFVTDIEGTTWGFGSTSGYIVMRDKPWYMTAETDAGIAAHELGHVFGLHHVCDDRDPELSLSGRTCTSEFRDVDTQSLMYPTSGPWTREGTYLSEDEANIARAGAAEWHDR